MKEKAVRIEITVPAQLYRRLLKLAAAKGYSLQELVVSGVEKILIDRGRLSSRRLRFPLIVSEGPKVDLTNEEIYEQVGFP